MINGFARIVVKNEVRADHDRRDPPADGAAPSARLDVEQELERRGGGGIIRRLALRQVAELVSDFLAFRPHELDEIAGLRDLDREAEIDEGMRFHPDVPDPPGARIGRRDAEPGNPCRRGRLGRRASGRHHHVAALDQGVAVVLLAVDVGGDVDAIVEVVVVVLDHLRDHLCLAGIPLGMAPVYSGDLGRAAGHPERFDEDAHDVDALHLLGEAAGIDDERIEPTEEICIILRRLDPDGQVIPAVDLRRWGESGVELNVRVRQPAETKREIDTCRHLAVDLDAVLSAGRVENHGAAPAVLACRPGSAPRDSGGVVGVDHDAVDVGAAEDGRELDGGLLLDLAGTLDGDIDAEPLELGERAVICDDQRLDRAQLLQLLDDGKRQLRAP